MLYIIATPIGNREDMTFRAVRMLKEADVILAEDTRVSRALLEHHQICGKQILSFYEHNETGRIPQVVHLLEEGKTVALISSAGTPLVSDPGFRLIRACRQKNIKYTVLPGPSSVINAVVLSGLECEKFIFIGFLPRKKGKQRSLLATLSAFPYSIFLFESPYRLAKTLDLLNEFFGQRECVVLREMTKLYEEVRRGTCGELAEYAESHKIQGEIVIGIGKQTQCEGEG